MIEYKIELAGTPCSVVEWNPGGSILVFAFHGWLDNLASFESLVPFLPDIRLVAVDFPGHGHSDHLLPGRPYHFIDGIYVIDDLANHFGQQKINLLGHSMGGALSILYAAAEPGRVNKMVIIESLGPLTSEPGEVQMLLHNTLSQRRSQLDKNKPVYPRYELALGIRAQASQIEAFLIEPIVERGLTKIEGGYTWSADSRLRNASPIRLSESHVLSLIQQIHTPVLLIEGESGYLRNKAQFDARFSLFKTIERVIFTGGHHVHLEQPEQCAQQIRKFFA
ncbi:alpha/beta fold hydrolase [Aliikangiella maris]|uniref:Alpha/beta hydrolase n=2 Tax=Aliikangiella maris TaxID=3162458 RepID=A0ABV3MKC6_9GAMM